MPLRKNKASGNAIAQLAFTPPMECASVALLPEGPDWSYELKLDGVRAQAMHTANGLRLLSRTGTDLSARFAPLLQALTIAVPYGASVDGELCALDERGYASFQLLQEPAIFGAQLTYFAFDMLALAGRSLTASKLDERRGMLQNFVRSSAHVQISHDVPVAAAEMVGVVRKHGLEGIIAKRRSGTYESGLRTGSWVKLRLSRAQEFVIGGFIPGSYGFEALIVGFYRAGQLIYSARVRNGFVPATRRSVHAHLLPFLSRNCPFANLPESTTEKQGLGLTADKMLECVWVQPRAVAQIAFLEWASSDHLRHARFLGLRDDKNPRSVIKEL